MRILLRPFSIALAWCACGLSIPSLQAQSITTEFDGTAGYSSDAQTWAGSTQLRAFGEIRPQTRFHVEGTWAQRSEEGTDAFNAAYSYSGHAQLNEAYLEHSFQSGSVFAYVRGGQYRTPFGIYSRADHGYTGFLRAPLARSGYYWTVNNSMLDRGIDFSVGTAHLTAEVSVATPGDPGGPGDNEDTYKRQSGLGGVVHVQAYFKNFIVGASHLNSKSYPAEWTADPGRMNFSSVDARWSYPGIQLRGEWIYGKEFTNEASITNGGYLDAILHTPSMGPVTAVFRTETLSWFYMQPQADGSTTREDWRGYRQTVGARVRIPGGLTAQFNLLYHSKLVAYDNKQTAFDIALTYSIRGNKSKRESPR